MHKLLLLLLTTTIYLCTVCSTTSGTGTDLGDGHDEYFRQFGPGINLIPASCAPASITAINKALNSTVELAQAAINAASNFSSAPFNRFFLPDPGNATFVAEGMRRVIHTIGGHGVSVGITCWDLSELCNTGRKILAYALPSNTSLPIIVYCPAGLAHPLNPPPCTRPPGLPTVSLITLHEFWHLGQISGTGYSLQDEGYSAGDAMAAVAAGNDSSNNAQAYALLGSFSYDLGLQNVDAGGRTCVENINSAILDETTLMKLVPVVTYCLLDGPNSVCGFGFECIAVRWTDPELIAGIKLLGEAASKVGVCASIHSKLDYTG
ncbi:MAG: hypothetical protein M1836_005052 [Candelina mexicana]|nr:MAG: hypothetical protein M1836_005052 [Candelina mexicana]